MGFKDVKRELITALLEDRYWFVKRATTETKNLVHTGEVDVEFVALLVMGSRGSEHSSFPHHGAKDINVHVLVTSGWYIKFFFVGSLASLISVHRTGMP